MSRLRYFFGLLALIASLESAVSAQDSEAKKDNTRVVTIKDTGLLIGSAVVATIPKGTQLDVIGITDDHVSVMYAVDGEEKEGRIHVQNTAKPGTRRKIRLKSIEIPTDSPHRDNQNLNKPPCLYVIIKRNGVPFEWYSSSVTGWRVTFPVSEKNNTWPIRFGTQDRYDIVIWDEQWGPDDQILSIVQLPGDRLCGDAVIIEPENESVLSPDRLVKITFEDLGDWPEKKD